MARLIRREIPVPLLALPAVATSVLTEDEASVTRALASSNGFGLIGHVIALSAGSNIMGGTLDAISIRPRGVLAISRTANTLSSPTTLQIEVDLGPLRLPWLRLESSQNALTRNHIRHSQHVSASQTRRIAAPYNRRALGLPWRAGCPM